MHIVATSSSTLFGGGVDIILFFIDKMVGITYTNRPTECFSCHREMGSRPVKKGLISMKSVWLVRGSFVALLVSALFATNVLAVPQVVNLGTEEDVPGGDGRLPSIAVDTYNQPHIVMDVGGTPLNYFFDKLPTGWNVWTYNSGGSQSYNPHIEINDFNQAWVSVVKWWPQGMGMFLIDNVGVTPTLLKYSGTKGGTGGLPISNLSLDPSKNNESVVYGGNGGNWEKVYWNGTAFASGGTGSMGSSLSGGEKNYFWLSRAGDFAHAGAINQPVWHACTDYNYNNTVRSLSGKDPVLWANFSTYPYMGNDGAYPIVVSDSVEPQTAYLLNDYKSYGGPGIVMNIWKATDNSGNGGFVRSASGLLVVDSEGISGLRRYEPQAYPANKGGVWLCYSTPNGKVRIRYAPSSITSAADLTNFIEFAGMRGAICVDAQGNLHVAYLNGGLKYRKITIAGDAKQSPKVGVAGDFDGDGKDDLGVYDSSTGNWFVKKRGTAAGIVQQGFNWGSSDMWPMTGAYDRDSVDEFAVYQPSSGAWYIRELLGLRPPVLMGTVWGGPTLIPVAGDYNGDGQDDMAVYDINTGKWFIRTIGGTLLFFDGQWGGAGSQPVPGDYDGDGVNDLAVFEQTTGHWYIKSLTDKVLYFGGEWGAGLRPVPGDYDGDGVNDLAVYEETTGNWYIKSIKKKADAPPLFFGAPFPGGGAYGYPVPGDFNDDGADDIALYYPATGQWYVRSLNGSVIANGRKFGGAEWYPLMGHFGASGAAELCLFSEGTWFVSTLSAEGKPPLFNDNWGSASMQSLVLDFDGDGTDDQAAYDSATGAWYIKKVDGTALLLDLVLGGQGWEPLVGDFNGDGKGDIAVYQTDMGNWNVRYSSETKPTGPSFVMANWGETGFIPIVGDFDNDGKSDFGLYDPATGKWYARKRDGTHLFDGVAWGDTIVNAVPFSGNYGGNAADDLGIYDVDSGEWWIREAPPSDTPIYLGLGWGSSEYTPLVGDFNGDGVMDPAVYESALGRWFIYTVLFADEWGGMSSMNVLGR